MTCIEDLMMAMMGNGIGSKGSVIGGREKEIREEVLGSVFCAFGIGIFFFFFPRNYRAYRENGLERQRKEFVFFEN